MTDENAKAKQWWQLLSEMLAAIAALIAAFVGVYHALNGNENPHPRDCDSETMTIEEYLKCKN